MFSKIKIGNKKQKKGFTLIEALTLLFIFSLIATTFYNAILMGTRYMLVAKNRLGAVALGNEKMEIARNLKYEDIGTVGGVVQGNLPQVENVSQNGRSYRVETLVKYEDDPFDGTLSGSPKDLAYKDYKTVKIDIIWNYEGADEGRVELISRFVAPGLEAISAGDGILSINVASDQAGGNPVGGSRIRIINEDVDIDQVVETDDEGNVILAGAPESIQRYHLIATKSGYESVETYPIYPDTPFNPNDTHASVLAGTINLSGLVQNKTANLKIKIQDYKGDLVSDVDYKIKGGRELGKTVTIPNEIVYNLDEDDKSDSDGEKNYSSISPGQYFFNLSPEESEFEFIGSSEVSPFSIASESDFELVVKVAEKNETSLLAKVFRSSDGLPIEGAKIKISNQAIAYEKEADSEKNGLTFFPVPEDSEFQAGEYSVSVEADGFKKLETTVDVVAGAIYYLDAPLEAE